MSQSDIQCGVVTLTQDSTFFKKADIWPMKDSADPLEGWPSKEVADTSSGPAIADLYGKLFYYVHDLLWKSLDRLSSLTVSFKMFQMDISLLPDHIEEETFNRIGVSA